MGYFLDNDGNIRKDGGPVPIGAGSRVPERFPRFASGVVRVTSEDPEDWMPHPVERSGVQWVPRWVRERMKRSNDKPTTGGYF